MPYQSWIILTSNYKTCYVIANKRWKSKVKRINPTLWVFCEGKTEVAYINFIKQKYRISSLQIDSHLSGNNITNEKITNFKKGKPIHNKDKTFLMYDSDVESTVRRLNTITDCTLLLSNPCIELWFLLHCKNQTATITCKELVKDLNNRFNYKKGTLNEKLKNKLDCKNKEATKKAIKLKPNNNPNTTIYQLMEYLNTYK